MQHLCYVLCHSYSTADWSRSNCLQIFSLELCFVTKEWDLLWITKVWVSLARFYCQPFMEHNMIRCSHIFVISRVNIYITIQFRSLFCNKNSEFPTNMDLTFNTLLPFTASVLPSSFHLIGIPWLYIYSFNNIFDQWKFVLVDGFNSGNMWGDVTIILCKLELGIKYFHQNNSSLALSWLEHYITNCLSWCWWWDECCYSWLIHVGIPTTILLVKCKNRPEIFTAGLTFIEEPEEWA